MRKKTVMTDPHCLCGKAIVGTVKDDIRHGKRCCTPVGCELEDREVAYPDPGELAEDRWNETHR